MGQITIKIVPATAADRDAIYRLRHAVYAEELGQHPTNADGVLRDALDDANEYLIAYYDTTLAGCISITPPGGSYSLDKYLPRDEWPFPVDDGLFEVRLLTVSAPFRNTGLAAQLMYAALQGLMERQAKNVIAMGRREVLPLYQRLGLRSFGRTIRSGAVTFELMGASVSELGNRSRDFLRLLARWGYKEQEIRPATEEACYHGGAFFDAIGPSFSDLNRRFDVVNADVLDAWFPPAPEVITALRDHLPWLLHTSPPTQCEGLRAAIATARSVPESAVVLGAGSSDLIFRAFQRWLTPDSRILVLDPTYGEYLHVLDKVIGCAVVRLPVTREASYLPDLNRLVEIGATCDLVVIVNPNNPTGALLPRDALLHVIDRLPTRTRVWVDEAYTDYCGPDSTLEPFVESRENLIVCKSLSKVFALSGARVAFLVAPQPLARDLRLRTPPWAVSLPAQVAAVHALNAPEYYAARYAETRQLRERLSARLRSEIPGMEQTVPGTNWLLCHLPTEGPTAAEVVARCRVEGVFLRDTANMSQDFGTHTLRIAVKDANCHLRIAQALSRCGIPVSHQCR